ncbi:PaaX family transcriptional regulator C-terminal domain-containing protein [Nocardiopsis sp. NPDC007018]|uniref:PaaX family transcriptional regulator n=1 Tax=Nocardiopsis sp. NPDC007018 TaxID=3155721 RepID=UPI0033FCBB01
MTSNSDRPAGAADPPPDEPTRTATEAERRRPRSLIVSFFGTHARDLGGWIGVGDLIALMSGLDVDGPAVRSAVSRLKRRGLLEPERLGGAAGYRLSERGRRILAEGDQRIFGHRVARVEDGWVLVVFSVPESERRRRHALRAQLTRLGFGTTAAGVWVAPAHLAPQARATLRDLGLEEHAELFHASHLGFRDLTSSVERWWDLPGLQAMYQDFLDEHEPVAAAWRRRSTEDFQDRHTRAAAFADHLRAVDAWRRMPYLDPGLPPELLPDRWAGSRAARVFFELHALLRGPGLEHVRSASAPGGPADP